MNRRKPMTQKLSINECKGDSFLDPQSEVSLHELRKFPGLNKGVDKQMSSLGLISSSSSDSDESSGSSFEEHGQHLGLRGKVKGKQSKRSKKSGLFEKSSDAVKFPHVWPHSALQFEFVSDSVSFMSLEPTTFVAGELEIIMSRRIEASEKVDRLKLMKKLMYFASIYECQALLKFYAAWVRSIEIEYLR